MTYKKGRITACGMAAVIMVSTVGLTARAENLSDLMPSAGIGVTFSNGVTLAKIQERVLAEAELDENLKLSVSEMKAYLEEQKTVPGTIVSASIVKEAKVQQVLAQIEVEQEALARAERLKGEPLPQQQAAGSETGNMVIATLANAASNEAMAGGNTNTAAQEQMSAAQSGEDAFSGNVLLTSQLTGQKTEETASAASVLRLPLALGTVSAAEASATEKGDSDAESEIKSSDVATDNTQSSVSGNDTKTGNDLKTETDTEKTDSVKEVEKKVIEDTQSTAELAAAEAASMTEEEREFSNLVIAKVKRYVNIRSDAGEDSEVVGKLYDKSVGTYISEKNGWYEISSGNVTGYVKAEYCVTGKEAVDLAKEIGTRIATVTTTTLKVREDASTESAVLGLVPIEEELTVVEEQDGWVKVDIEEGYGWVSKDYVSLRTDFVKAESKAEEDARLAKEAEERQKARAGAAANSVKPESGSSKSYNSASSFIPAGGGSASGNAVAQFALQFVGNPYVYGGTSLTNGADCSGFVMSVYKNFGVSLPHSSSADRHVGSAVGSLEEAQPGDLICYSGHVALYIGDNQIVHASTKKTGIKVSTANYRNIVAIRRIF